MTSNAVGSAFGRVAVGHPVDVASGEFFAIDIDHELAGVVPLSLGRTFNTRFVQKPLLESIGPLSAPWRPFGPGWRPTWFAELRQVLDGFLYTRADGTEFSILDPRGDKSFAKTGRIRSVDDGLEIERISDTQVRVVGYGRDRNEHALVFERGSGKLYRLVAIERTREARIDVVYDLAGRPSRLVQRRERRSYELLYEGERVTRVVLHLADRTERRAAEYIYDARGRLVSVHDARGVAALYEYDDEDRIVRDEKRGGSVYTVRYGRDGRCEYACGSNGYEERALRYDTRARKTWVTDSHGGVTLYEWNDRGQVIKTTTPCKVITRAEFDDRGRPVRQTLPNGELCEQVYDELGRVVVERQSGGTETRFHYDEQHRLTGYDECFDDEVVTRGRLTYDEDQNVTSVQVNDQPAWTYRWSPFAEPVTITAPSGAKASRQYDELGGLREATNWDGHAWVWTRDALGRVVTETDPLGHTWHVQYLDEDGKSLRLVEPDGRVYEREVSLDERSICQRLPGNRSQTVELSFCGQPIELRDEEGAVTRLSWGTEPGELLAITNANRVDYTFTYDADLRLIERRTFDGRVLRTAWEGARIAATYDGMGRRTTYGYDARGLVTTQTSDDGETALGYDTRARLESIVTPSSTLRLWRNELGRVIAEEQDGVRIERTLDLMGRPIARKTPFGPEARFAWTAGGACTAIGYGETEVAFERDALGRETKRHLGSAGVFEQAYDAVGRLVAQTFNPAARRGAKAMNSVVSPDGLTRQFGFDERGFLASVEDSLRGHTRLIHNARGDLTGVVRQGGSSDFYAYDPCQNRVYHAATEHGAALASALDKVARERSALGDVPVDVVAAQVPHLETSFGYAPGDRVVVLSRADGRTELTYDANGQVVAKTLFRGNERTTWTYGWNARGELVTVTTPNGKVWTYRYDGAGRRIEKRSPTGDKWRYVWMGAVVLHTLKNDALAETYLHEPGGTCPILRDNGAVHFILPDQNDSPSEEVSADGNLEWTAQKGTWGEGFNAVGASGAEPFLGQWYDAESGLHYNLFRYYDPAIGRYISPDPIALAGGLNTYCAISDPFTQYDRWGLAGGGANPCTSNGPATQPLPTVPPITKKAIIARLRQVGTPEALATAALIKRGVVQVEILPTDPWGQAGVGGRQPWGTNKIQIYTDVSNTPGSAAGVAAHETRHVLQGITPATYTRADEVDAFQWQRAAGDPSLSGWSDSQIANHVATHPAYANVPP
jgi:RHS repeat-associated protein